MAKIEGVIKSEIVRLAKREIRSSFLPLRREVRKVSLRLSGLSKGIRSLNRLAKELQLEKPQIKLEATSEEVKAARLSPDRIRGLRKKLGISMRELGILAGTSLSTVLSWETGKFRPKADKKAFIVALRKLRKRDIKKILAEKKDLTKTGAQKARAGNKRGKKRTPSIKAIPKRRRLAARKLRKAARA